jgi:hypothetical protein
VLMFVPCVMAGTGMFLLVAPLLVVYGEQPFTGTTLHDVLILPSSLLSVYDSTAGAGRTTEESFQ